MVICLPEILVGVLLLIDPIGFTSGIIIMVGIALMLFGCVCVIRYFHTSPDGTPLLPELSSQGRESIIEESSLHVLS